MGTSVRRAADRPDAGWSRVFRPWSKDPAVLGPLAVLVSAVTRKSRR